MAQENTKKSSHLWKNVVYFILFFVFFAHIFQASFVKIDSIALGLLGLFLLIPYIQQVKKIKFGEFEAEINQREVESVKAKVEQSLGIPIADGLDSKYSDILKIVEADPQLGLAKLRIEIEALLKRFLPALELERKQSIGSLIKLLYEKDVLPRGVISAIKDILPLANRAIHGEHVNEKQAKEIVLMGISVIDEMKRLLAETFLRPKEVIPISVHERDMLQTVTQFKVTTVVPLVDGPYKNIYVFNQERLNEFLVGYELHAEFLISIEKISE